MATSQIVLRIILCVGTITCAKYGIDQIKSCRKKDKVWKILLTIFLLFNESQDATATVCVCMCVRLAYVYASHRHLYYSSTGQKLAREKKKKNLQFHLSNATLIFPEMRSRSLKQV